MYQVSFQEAIGEPRGDKSAIGEELDVGCESSKSDVESLR